MEKSAGELYQDRLKRVEDAIQLRQPDRVPFLPHINFFAARYVGLDGDCGSRLEYFTEFPKGKVLALLDSTDIFRAKEILGNTMCLAGNMPPSLLSSGTTEEVTQYTRKLIDIVGKDGGFIMSSRTALDDANPVLVKLWADLTHEYGVYQ